MNYITWIHIIIFAFAVIFAATPFVILRIGYKRYSKWEHEHFNIAEYNTFGDYLDNKGAISGIYMVIIACAAIFALIWGGIILSHLNYSEDTRYAVMIARQETITDLLNSSDNSNKESLYIEAIEFNSELAEIQSVWQKGLYSITFSGDYDWSLIEPVKIDQKTFNS